MTNYKPAPFYNRTSELKALDRAWSRRGKGGLMMLLYGRRRLGKTYLLQRYFAGGVTGEEIARPHCYYLAEQTTAATQRTMLASQFLSSFPNDAVNENDIAVSWNALLRYISQQAHSRDAAEGRLALILDEFPYLVEQSPELPSIIQAWWDREGVHIPLMWVLCGSQLSVMASLGKESAPLFGRFDGGIFKLEPLSFYDVASFYEGNPLYGVSETLLMYGVLGGTPRYHALVDTSRPYAEEIITLLMQPRAILENEVRFLLGSEQIREPALYNAVLGAIASGSTQFNRIQDKIEIERSQLSFYLRNLQELGWIRRELPFKEKSERRSLYRIADPFLTFWYRFIAPLSSALQFSHAEALFDDRVEPFLADYMGLHAFEEICTQWLRRFAKSRLNMTILETGRYWSRDGSIEIDIVAEMDDGAFLFAECKWRSNSEVRLSDYTGLRSKVERLPEASWRVNASYLLFSAGGFEPILQMLATDPTQRLTLVSGAELLSR